LPLIKSPEQFVSDVLADGLWHTTSRERFHAALISGGLLAESDLLDCRRHKTAKGPSNYPFARLLGGVSLFDFARFDSASYEAAYPVSNWRSFVPTRPGGGESLWIELDPSGYPAVIRGTELLAEWKAQKAFGHTIMPLIEAAHIGDIPTKLFHRVVAVRQLSDRSYDVRPVIKASRSTPGRN
jgi:hypothetical protein